jgi:hypothetical protein
MALASGQPPLLRGRPAVPPPRSARPTGPSTLSLPGRPAVPAGLALTAAPASPPAGRPSLAPAAPEADVPAPAGDSGAALVPAKDAGRGLATVTRLVPLASTGMVRYGLNRDDELVVRLLALGLPEFLIGPEFPSEAAVRGTYAALTRTLADRMPPVPDAPSEPGDVLLVVGPGAEALNAAQSLALTLRQDPDRVQWATSGGLAGLAPESSRITTLETAFERHRASENAGTVTIVAVDAPLRSNGGTWLSHMIAIWGPDAVWAVVDATRKIEDVAPWLDGLPRLDAVVLQETDCTADPAAVLSHLTAPVALVDGVRASAHRWASLLCERLDELNG